MPKAMTRQVDIDPDELLRQIVELILDYKALKGKTAQQDAPQTMPNISPRLQVKITEAGEMLGFQRRTVERMMRAGDLEYTGHRRSRRITTASIYAYIEKNRTNNAD